MQFKEWILNETDWPLFLTTWLEQDGNRRQAVAYPLGSQNDPDFDEEEYEDEEETMTRERSFAERRFAFESWFPGGQDRIYIPFKSNVSEDDDSDLEGDDSDIVELINDFKGGGKYPESEDGYEVVDYAKGLASPKKVVDKHDTPEKLRSYLQTKKHLSPEKIDQIVADKFGVSEAQRNLYKIRGILDQIKSQEESKIKSKLDNQEISQNKYNYSSNKQAEYMDDIIRWFEMSPSRSGSGKSKEYAIVISKNPEDIEKMSTGRSWSSCMEIGKDNTSQVYCEVKDGGFIAYLTTPDDKEIKNPKSRVLIRRLDSKIGKSIAVVEESIYGWEVPGFVQEVKKWVESKQGKIEPGKYQLKGAEHSDTFSDKEIILPDNIKDLWKFADRIMPAEARLQLKNYANKHDIKNVGDVPSIFERWVKMNMDEKMGITPEDAKRARESWHVVSMSMAEAEDIRKEAIDKIIEIDKETPLDTKSAKRLYDLAKIAHKVDDPGSDLEPLQRAAVLGVRLQTWRTFVIDLLSRHPELNELVVQQGGDDLVDDLLDDMMTARSTASQWNKLKRIYGNFDHEQQNRVKEEVIGRLMEDMQFPPKWANSITRHPEDFQASEYQYIEYYNDLINKAEILSPIPYPIVKKIMEVADELYKMPLIKMMKMREAGSGRRVSEDIEEKILQSFANLLSNTKTPAASHFISKYLNFRGSKGFDYGSMNRYNTWFSTLVNMGEKAKQFLPQLKTELKKLEDKIADLDAEQLNFHHDKRKLEIAREEYLYTIDSIEKGRPSQKYYPFQVVDQRFGPLTAR